MPQPFDFSEDELEAAIDAYRYASSPRADTLRRRARLEARKASQSTPAPGGPITGDGPHNQSPRRR